MAKNVVCPDCSGQVEVWAEIDATLRFDIRKSGKLFKKRIENNFQSDGRSGIKCKECDWEMHAYDCPDDSEFYDILSAAWERQEAINQLSEKRSS